MASRRSLDDPDSLTSRHEHGPLLSRITNRSRDDLSKRTLDRHSASSESLGLGNNAADLGTSTKLATVSESEPSFHFPYMCHTSGSRAPSARASSSSLQALDENAVVDSRSSDVPPPPRPSFAQRMARRFTPPSESRTSFRSSLKASTHDYPVYPDQSYAVLQSQVHPTVHMPKLGSRNSHRARFENRDWISASRAPRNPRSLSPGLFSVNSSAYATPASSDDESRVSYLHPTHLQPPKEYAIFLSPSFTS